MPMICVFTPVEMCCPLLFTGAIYRRCGSTVECDCHCCTSVQEKYVLVHCYWVSPGLFDLDHLI